MKNIEWEWDMMFVGEEVTTKRKAPEMALVFNSLLA